MFSVIIWAVVGFSCGCFLAAGPLSLHGTAAYAVGGICAGVSVIAAVRHNWHARRAAEERWIRDNINP